MASNNSERNFKNFLSQIFLYKETDKYDFSLPTTSNDTEEDIEENSNQIEKVFTKLADNLEYMKVQYNLLLEYL